MFSAKIPQIFLFADRMSFGHFIEGFKMFLFESVSKTAKEMAKFKYLLYLIFNFENFINVLKVRTEKHELI